MAKAAHLDVESETDDELNVRFLLGFEKSDEDEDEDRREVFRIGDLAREFGVTLRTLRFYEDRGLLSPERRGTTRLYSRKDRTRLRLVLLGKALGFSLTEARQMIDVYHQPNGRRRQMEVALERFAEQKQILLAQLEEVQKSIEAMDLSIDVVENCLRKA